MQLGRLFTVGVVLDTSNSMLIEGGGRLRPRPFGRRRGAPFGSADASPSRSLRALLSRISTAAARPRVALPPRGSRAPVSAGRLARAPSLRSRALGSLWPEQAEVHADWPRLSGAVRRGARRGERAQLRLEGSNVPRLVPSVVVNTTLLLLRRTFYRPVA